MSNKLNINLMGGIGNQLFISAFAHLTAALNKDLAVHLSLTEMPKQAHESSIFNLDGSSLFGDLDGLVGTRSGSYFLESLHRRLAPKAFAEFQEIGLSAEPLEVARLRNARGYFQSDAYVQQLRGLGAPLEIRSLVASSGERAYIEELSESPFTSAHVRLGDYRKLKDSFGLLGVDFFKDCISRALELGNRRFLLFSDEPNWWLENLSKLPPADYVIVRGLGAESQLELMAKAEISIISNSTFSLWGSLAGARKRAVFAPDPWFRNMVEPRELLPATPETIRVQARWG